MNAPQTRYFQGVAQCPELVEFWRLWNRRARLLQQRERLERRIVVLTKALDNAALIVPEPHRRFLP